MNSDTSQPDRVTDVDPRLSAAYRDLETPAPPAELDRRILDEAAAAVPAKPLWRLRRWTRPLAWAVTITLCAAIVLEITQVPGPDGLPPKPALDMESAAPAATDEPEDTGGATFYKLSETPVTAPAGVSDFTRQDAVSTEAPRQRKPENAMSTPPEDFTPPSAERASEPAAAALPEARALMDHRAEVSASDAVPAPACDAEQRADPDRWLACIEGLERRGDEEGARRERDLLEETFPDFLPR